MDFITNVIEDPQQLVDFALDLPFFLWRLMTPPPVSPHFKEGGIFYGYNEDIFTIVGTTLLLAVLDFTFVKRFVVPKARYFALHTITNALVCYVTIGAVHRTFTEDPLTVFHGPAEDISCNTIIAALHLYHCLAFSLSADDIFHHLTFCATLCSMAIPVKQISGASVPFGAFFLSGLPGGIDYLMLTLTAHGYVSKDFQKNLYQKLNVYMRAPALTLYMLICWIETVHTDHPLSVYVTIVSCYLHFYNGQYYGQQAIESNAIYKYKKKLEKMGIRVPDVKLSDLKREDGAKAKAKKDDAAKNKSSAVASAAPSDGNGRTSKKAAVLP